ncbi:MAG: hypothetical protein IJS19_07145 [Muribaculaceae bacterium]|nr:hypothetical protein [Muribaculaceae bacterium]
MDAKKFTKVCRCTLNGEVKILETSVVKQNVDDVKKVLRESRRPALRVSLTLNAATLCLVHNLPNSAIDVLSFAIRCIVDSDYSRALNASGGRRFRAFVNKNAALTLATALDKIYRSLGHKEMAKAKAFVINTYRMMREDYLME